MTNHRTALVTGATRGIGLALARRLAASGWRVVGIARHASDDFPGRLLCCDLADPAQTAETLRGLLSESAVDALVNNAGIALPQSLENLDLAALQQVFDLNVRVAVQLAQACLPGLKRSPAGRIVNLCSRAIHGARERTAYAAAKSALVGVTRTWALELAPLGITVNAVAPGPVATELFFNGKSAEQIDQIARLAPLERLGEPDEIAAAVSFLAGPDGAWVNSQVLRVNGGFA